jgi:zinc D-Ala-D-Ala carboxypeptidase
MARRSRRPYGRAMTTRTTTAAAALLALITATTAPIFGHALGVQPAGPPPPADLPQCVTGSQPAPRAGYVEWRATILDTLHRLPPGYVPPDLVDADLPGGSVRLRAFVVDDLRRMLAAAAADGVTLKVNSGYRSFAEQAALFDEIAATRGTRRALRSVARPGHSEHQLGTAVDLGGGAEWLRNNSWRFGFVLSYPAGRSPNWTCYIAEPWHFRYFGRGVAAAIHHSGLSPREWLWQHQPELAQRN